MTDAAQAGTPVHHPLLDKVRECSADPDAAADFFQRILHPRDSSRLSVEAHTHKYVAATFNQMRECKAAKLQTGNSQNIPRQSCGDKSCNRYAAASVSHNTCVILTIICNIQR